MSQVIDALRGERTWYLQTFLVSALVFMLYDTIINLKKEVGFFMLLCEKGTDSDMWPPDTFGLGLPPKQRS